MLLINFHQNTCLEQLPTNRLKPIVLSERIGKSDKITKILKFICQKRWENGLNLLFGI